MDDTDLGIDCTIRVCNMNILYNNNNNNNNSNTERMNNKVKLSR
jgi:hypothetical protein